MYNCLSCLCVSIICIVLILILLSELEHFIDEEGNEILTTHQLRGMYVKEIVTERYTNIYNGVVEASLNGKTTEYFNIMCIPLHIPSTTSTEYNRKTSTRLASSTFSSKTSIEKCNNYDGYQEWLTKRKYTHNGDPISNNINTRLIKNSVINKLQNVFPDSNITKSYKNCCEYYRINW